LEKELVYAKPSIFERHVEKVGMEDAKPIKTPMQAMAFQVSMKVANQMIKQYIEHGEEAKDHH
jgi:hypothetical protein